MNILITGGAGFIGKALAKKMLIEACCITVLDLKEKIASGTLIEGVEYLDCDISKYSSIKSMENKGIDFIFHLASQTSGLISQEDPSLDVDTNVKGTLNICRLATANPGSKITFTSSMAVYGDYKEAINESFPIKPSSNYGASKISAEQYIKLFEKRGVRNSILRLFNVYGPGQDLTNMKQGMLSIFMTQAILNGHIDITGSLERYRDFVYIDDIVAALMLTLDSSTDGEIYNVGTGVKTTVKSLVDSINTLPFSAPISVKNIGGFEGDQFGTYCDSGKLKKLGWAHKVDLNNGLIDTYNDAIGVLK